MSVGLKFEFEAAKKEFTQTQDGVNEAPADGHAEGAFLEGAYVVGGAMESGNCEGTKETGDHAADREFIGNDKVLEVDE